MRLQEAGSVLGAELVRRSSLSFERRNVSARYRSKLDHALWPNRRPDVETEPGLAIEHELHPINTELVSAQGEN